jgi:hypothetical protein
VSEGARHRWAGARSWPPANGVVSVPLRRSPLEPRRHPKQRPLPAEARGHQGRQWLPSYPARLIHALVWFRKGRGGGWMRWRRGKSEWCDRAGIPSSHVSLSSLHFFFPTPPALPPSLGHDRARSAHQVRAAEMQPPAWVHKPAALALTRRSRGRKGFFSASLAGRGRGRLQKRMGGPSSPLFHAPRGGAERPRSRRG